MTGCSAEIRRYFGLALIPQAGVSIGLAVLAQRILPAESGSLLSTIILSSSVLYEMIGPVCARKALMLAGAIKSDSHGNPVAPAAAAPAHKASKKEKKTDEKILVSAKEAVTATTAPAWRIGNSHLWP